MTAEYSVPLREMSFLYYELLNGHQIDQLDDFPDSDETTVNAILEEAAKFVEAEILPLNQIGDQQGCQLDGDEVLMPDGFQQAYQNYVAGGWTALSLSTEYGGMNLPYSVDFMMSEMMSSANPSFSIYPGLTRSAAKLIATYGNEAQKNLYLSKFAQGIWSGTMCLTEAQCGTDLGLISTKATANEDDTYALTGSKIFISAGEHPLSENIIHLVLARLPDAPEGIKGISLFVVPKFIPTDSGEIGERNQIHCGALEHKMGIKANATCVMNLDAATGWLIGEPHRGMQAMFVMMNAARLGTGLQGFAAGERAYQGAVNYARERLQMRALTGTHAPDKKADPILVHPDVRRMLLTIRAYTEGCRAMSYWIAQELDFANHHPDPARRQQAEDLAALLTPVIKAFSTDTGFESTNLGVQIYGGHGYISEHGMEQLVRDVRIAQLYEGTNGIQALDLIARKLPMHDGRLLKVYLQQIEDFIKTHQGDTQAEPFIQPLVHGVSILQEVTAWITAAARENINHKGAAATDYLQIFGLVTLAYMWSRIAIKAQQQSTSNGDDFYASKISTARFYMAKLLPKIHGLMLTLMTGADSIMDIPEEQF